MRIVSVCRQVPRPDNPAAGTSVVNRVAAMSRVADVTMIQPVPYMPLVRPLPAWAAEGERRVGELVVAQAPMFYIPGVFKFADPWWLERAVAPRVRALHASAPVDVIDGHFAYPDGVGCVTLARRLGVSSFITIRGVEVEQLKIPGKRARIVAAMRAATGCISVSHSLKKVAVDHGVPEEQITVIHNAIDTRTFSRGDKGAARAALGVQADADLIVSVGYLVSGKRHHLLIEAFARVLRNRPGGQLVIVGGASFEPAYPAQLQRLAHDLGVADRVRFAGNIPADQVARWLHAADVFALATEREGCCNAVLEALATGLPVVTTPAGDNAHFVKDGVNGLLFPIDDVPALAAALEQALKMSWDADRISQGLNAQVGSWDRVAEKVLAYMRERREGIAGLREAA